MNEFWAMGGYGAYVWSSFVLAALIVGWNIWSAVAAHREARKRALRNIAMTAAGSPGRSGA